MEDIRIIELYWDRDQTAIRASDAKYGKLLYSISNGILSDRQDSEECVSDTYLRAWDNMPPQRPNSLRAFLGRITRNLSINRLEAREAQKRRWTGGETLLSELGDCVPAPDDPAKAVEAKELTHAIEEWLVGLGKSDRILFIRRYWYGDSLTELAELQATTPNKLAGRLYRLRGKLKAHLIAKEVWI